MSDLSVSDVSEALVYEPESGALRWRRQAGRHGRMPAGSIAGSKNNEGYVHVSIAGKKVKAHRIAFALMTGDWPHGVIDHINMDRGDNRWNNLRLATRSLNKANQRKRADSQNQFKGVTRQQGGRFSASITRNGDCRYLGCFDSEIEAANAYAQAACTTFGEYARTT
jgi:hypothetical protein